eukprot:14785854-Ditylum_brightwellii.AAC.1
MSTAGRGAAAISILIDTHNRPRENAQFKLLLDAFKMLFISDYSDCLAKKRLNIPRGRKLENILFEEEIRNLLSDDEDRQTEDHLPFEDLLDSYLDKKRRRRQEIHPDCLFGNVTDGLDPCTSEGFWDPWHKDDIMRSFWFYAYDGSLTEPPCYPFVGWRIVDTPMLISRKQLNDLRSLIFLHQT